MRMNVPHTWRIAGHDHAVDFLRRGLLHGRSRHAYLFTGSASLGKMTLAREYAMALNCEDERPAMRPCRQCRSCQSISRGHDPDLIIAGVDDGGGLKIDDIRRITGMLALKPYAARYRVAILDDFHLVEPRSQDALLKTLEEPAPHALLILLAEAGERILPTIRSRAQQLSLRSVASGIIRSQLIKRGSQPDRADLIAGLSGGRMGWALAALADDDVLRFRGEMLDLLREILAGGRLQRLTLADQLSRRIGRDKGQMRQILDIWKSYWRDVLLLWHDCPVKLCNSDRQAEINELARAIDASQGLRAMNATRRMTRTLDTNANLRLALDALFLDYPGLDA